MSQRFPVLVTGYMKYIVWVDEDNAVEAHKAIQGCEGDWVEGVQPVDAWLEAEAKLAETAEFIWVFGGSFMPQHDAHVQTHRSELWRQENEQRKAACAAEGHLDRTTYTDGQTWCKGCSSYVVVEVIQ